MQSLDSTFGALLLGTFFSVILYGLGLHQTYRYFRLYPSDTVFIRVIVVSLLILETLQTTFSMHSCYYYLVTNYSNSLALKKSVWSANLIAVTGALITITSQLFFLRRVSLISRTYRVLSGLAIAFLAWNLACNIILSYDVFKDDSVSAFTKRKWVMPMSYGAVTGVNILITGSLMAALRRARVDPNNATAVTDTLVIYVINTGVLVVIFDFASMVMAITRPNDLYWVPLGLVTARLYMNTLLSVLNSRKLCISRGIEVFEASPFGANILSRANRLAAVERWNVPQLPDETQPTMLDIKVTTEIEEADRVGTSSTASQHDRKTNGMEYELETRSASIINKHSRSI